jgi:hypothetical protein
MKTFFFVFLNAKFEFRRRHRRQLGIGIFAGDAKSVQQKVKLIKTDISSPMRSS